MSIQKINVGGQDVEIEDVSARTNITSINNTIGSETLQTTSKTLKGAINEVKQSVGGSGGGGLPCIDTTNLIYEQHTQSNAISYTATEDCIMCLSLGLWAEGTYIKINNTKVFEAECGSSSSGAPSFMTLNLKSGDVFQFNPAGNSANRISYKVFGIRY